MHTRTHARTHRCMYIYTCIYIASVSVKYKTKSVCLFRVLTTNLRLNGVQETENKSHLDIIPESRNKINSTETRISWKVETIATIPRVTVLARIRLQT